MVIQPDLTMNPKMVKAGKPDLTPALSSEENRSAGIETGLALVNSEGKIGWWDEPGFQPHSSALGGSLPRIA